MVIILKFLSLTLEKRACIHYIAGVQGRVQSYKPRTFYLAGTDMKWCVFLKDGNDQHGELIDKDPQAVFQ